MKVRVVVHEADEGGSWAEVPAIPGCATEGETLSELLENLSEAIEGCLTVETEKEYSSASGETHDRGDHFSWRS